MRYRIPDLGSGHRKTEKDDRHTGCEGRQSGRMLAWQIQTADAGYSVEKYLTGRCGFTKTQVRRLKFRKHGMQVNGMQVRSTYLLSEGEVLSVCLDDSAAESHEMEASGTVPEILYGDADVIAVWKPAGEVVHPSHGHYQDTLANRLQSYFQGRGEHVTIRSIGRLDADTAGILIFAKNQFAAQRLWRQRENGQFHKTYAAWCEGVFCEGSISGRTEHLCTDRGDGRGIAENVRDRQWQAGEDVLSGSDSEGHGGISHSAAGHRAHASDSGTYGVDRASASGRSALWKWDTGKDKGRSDSMEAEFCQP